MDFILGIMLFLTIVIGVIYIYFSKKLKHVREDVRNEIFNSVKLEAEKQNQDIVSKIEKNTADLVTIEEKIAESKIKAHKIQEELKTFEEERKKYGEAIEVNEFISQQKSKLRRLMLEVAKYEDILDMQEVGIYKPYFNFDTSEKYKDKIISIKEEQKTMIRDGRACVCDTPWTVNGSRSQGAAMAKENIKLALRAFNNECDSIIAKVDYKNIERSEERVQKAFDYINKLNTRNDVRILHTYLSLKKQELRATYEYAVKKEEERQEQLRIKEQMREELKAQKELEKAKLDAEKAQREYEKEIERAKKLLEKDKQNERLREKLAKLEKELQEAIAKGQRAVSQAQLTKSGHVYPLCRKTPSFRAEI